MTKKRLPDLWIWRLDKITSDALIRIEENRPRVIYLKVLDEIAPNLIWSQQLGNPWVRVMQEKGVIFKAWGYHRGRRDPVDIVKAVETIKTFGMAEYIFDIEERGDIEDVSLAERQVEECGKNFGKDFLSFTSSAFCDEFERLSISKIAPHCGTAYPQVYFAEQDLSHARPSIEKSMVQYGRFFGNVLPILNSVSDDGSVVPTNNLEALMKLYPNGSVFRVPHEGEGENPLLEISL